MFDDVCTDNIPQNLETLSCTGMFLQAISSLKVAKWLIDITIINVYYTYQEPRVLNYWVDRKIQEDFVYRDATTLADVFTILISWYTFRASYPNSSFCP
jgi:hypothetical protein